jgi:hypothetical protein
VVVPVLVTLLIGLILLGAVALLVAATLGLI